MEGGRGGGGSLGCKYERCLTPTAESYSPHPSPARTPPTTKHKDDQKLSKQTLPTPWIRGSPAFPKGLFCSGQHSTGRVHLLNTRQQCPSPLGLKCKSQGWVASQHVAGALGSIIPLSSAPAGLSVPSTLHARSCQGPRQLIFPQPRILTGLACSPPSCINITSSRKPSLITLHPDSLVQSPLPDGPYILLTLYNDLYQFM